MRPAGDLLVSGTSRLESERLAWRIAARIQTGTDLTAMCWLQSANKSACNRALMDSSTRARPMRAFRRATSRSPAAQIASTDFGWSATSAAHCAICRSHDANKSSSILPEGIASCSSQSSKNCLCREWIAPHFSMVKRFVGPIGVSWLLGKHVFSHPTNLQARMCHHSKRDCCLSSQSNSS